MSLVLRPYQVDMVDFIIAHPRCNVFSFMGSGKTIAVLTALDDLHQAQEPVFPCLVVAPKRVAISTWPDEVAAHRPHLRISPVIGTPKERLAALRKPAHIYTINHDNLRWLRDTLGDRWPFKTVVADESSRLKSFRLGGPHGRRARELASVSHRSARHINLSGTPVSNGLMDLWGPQWFVDFGSRLGRSYGAFRDRWFYPVQRGSEAFAVSWEPYSHAQGEIQGSIADVTLSLDPHDHFDLHEPIITHVPVTLPPKARAIYDDMHQRMYAELASGGVEAFNAGVKSGKLLQIASGIVYTESGAFEDLHTEKLDALDSIIAEACGAPILVAYHFKADLHRLTKRFPTASILDDRPKTIRDWNAGKIPLLLAHPKSAGHGLNLQHGGHRLVFFSLDWALEDRLQIIERIGPVRQLQAGYDRPVYIYYILARDTLDYAVLERVDGKKSVLDTLIEALKK